MMKMNNTLNTLALTVGISSATFASTVTVGPGGKFDFDNIQDAIYDASNGDEIIVAPGVYVAKSFNGYPQTEIVNTMGKSIWLHSSHGSASTILDGYGQVRGILCDMKENGNTIIQGFTIQDCVADGGGGMYLNHTSPTISDCVFVNNQSGGYGGSYFYYTESGGGILINAGSPVISDCVFVNNYAGYYGGAIQNKNFSNTTIANCSFDGNYAMKGGAISHTSLSQSQITSCSFDGNGSEYYGGAIYLVENCTVGISNCSMTENQTDIAGGGVYNQGGVLTIDQTILSENLSNAEYGWPTGGGGVALNTGEALITESAIKDNVAATGGGIFSFTGWNTSLEIGTTTFCGNDVDDIEGDWDDLGGNDFSLSCVQGACCTNDICVPIDEQTCVYVGGIYKGLNITCASAECQEACAGDLDSDGDVDVNDILSLIAAWGACP